MCITKPPVKGAELVVSIIIDNGHKRSGNLCLQLAFTVHSVHSFCKFILWIIRITLLLDKFILFPIRFHKFPHSFDSAEDAKLD